jgi:hypothetical protein
MNFTNNNTVINIKPKNEIKLPGNVRGIRNTSRTIGKSMFEQISGGNVSCGNCGGYKTAF